MKPEGHTETVIQRWTLQQAWNGTGQMVKFEHGEYVTLADHIAALQQANEGMRKALEEIANSPHQAYDGNAPYISEHSSGYALGVVDGHRCAANTARTALAEAGGEAGRV